MKEYFGYFEILEPLRPKGSSWLFEAYLTHYPGSDFEWSERVNCKIMLRCAIHSDLDFISKKFHATYHITRTKKIIIDSWCWWVDKGPLY